MTDPQLVIKRLNDTINHMRELLVNAEERGEMKAIVQFINQFPKSMTESDRQLSNKRLVYEFASWLSQQNFTNPDVSLHEWVERFFKQREKPTPPNPPSPEGYKSFA